MDKQDWDLCTSNQSDSLKGHVSGARARHRLTFSWAAAHKCGWPPRLHFDRALFISLFLTVHIFIHISQTRHPLMSRDTSTPVAQSFRPFPSCGSLVRFILSRQWVLRRLTAEKPRRTRFQACFLSAMSQDEKHVSSKNTWRLKFHAFEIDTQSKSGWFAGGRNLPPMVRNPIVRLLVTYKT